MADRLFLDYRLIEGSRQIMAQSFAGHLQDIQAGLAWRRFQKTASPAMQIKDLAAFTDQHPNRGVTLE